MVIFVTLLWWIDVCLHLFDGDFLMVLNGCLYSHGSIFFSVIILYCIDWKILISVLGGNVDSLAE